MIFVSISLLMAYVSFLLLLWLWIEQKEALFLLVLCGLMVWGIGPVT